MLKYKNIFIFILFILFIYTIINSNNNKQSHQQYKDETQFIIDSSNNLLIKNSEDNYSYYLNENNLLNINITDNIDNINIIGNIEFDSNNLNIYKVNDNKVKIQSQYELVPGKYKLKIIYKENKSPKIIDFNVIYLYDAKNEKFNKFNNHWTLSENCDVIEILNEGVKIGGNCEKQLILIQYKKNFDKDLTLKFDFNILNNKTIDMQLTFDERLYINFDNKKIKFQRKEINSNYKESIKTVKEIVYNKFKNNQKYSMIFSKEQNLYILKIIDFFTKEIYYEVNYKDDMSNIKTKHIYDNLRISVGRNNTIMLIESMEIY